MIISETLKKRLKMPIAILAVIVIVFLGYSILNFWNYQVSIGWGTNAGFDLTENNESSIPHEIFSLTEEDFKKIPKLAPVIRQKTQRVQRVWDNGTRILYSVHLTDDEKVQFTIFISHLIRTIFTDFRI